MPTVHNNINGIVNINDVNVSINIDFSNLVLNTQTNDEVVKGKKFDIPSDLDLDARLQAELDSLLPSMTSEESEIDARLQAELDSLPFIEVDNTDPPPLGSDPQNCAQISYAAVENEVPVDEMQVPHNDADLDNPIFVPLVGAPNTDFLQPMRTFGYFRNGHGEDIPVSFVLGPDGLVTNVSIINIVPSDLFSP
ncbi:uncharacterized protein LOC124461219 isoform X1 [Drosophila willistoni]|uniref:uncharacterized protein LOC124461216 isoform X1 n=1 Tax=Drosophila willistoni TaxID=7260 RepID=UPI001F07DE78|nr:uncharacterized protein LOC124461216 isoform X1 [Drosophila willistoni]XP_046868732.1 uncharacterized protein LOC124461217 isoform X1 [Drosophila willistoni]XP_046868734.1 uncharacterized protein LOC124461218 isoform X1 [Drosophila willistoni]XP_046868736.1 uncharacterized protein LOC124461219 isoform X1 [Drosophila willistoni]